MTAEEKRNIYKFLETAENWAFGYKSGNFPQEEPVFEDDIIVQPQISQPAADSANVEEQTGNLSQNNGSNNNVSDNNVSEAPKPQGITIESLSNKICNCKFCVLNTHRKNGVTGFGSEKPYVLVIGECPSELDNETGLPFSGETGALLDKMLGAINLDKNINCYLTNIVKCCPPLNRTAMPDEAKACSGYLQAQIHILKPKLILSMGRTSIQNLLETQQGLPALRGKFFEYNGIPLMATHAPETLLKDPSLKAQAWSDLKLFRTKLDELCPEYAEEFRKVHAN